MKLPTHPKDGLPSSEQTFPTTYKKLTKIIFQKTLLYSRQVKLQLASPPTTPIQQHTYLTKVCPTSSQDPAHTVPLTHTPHPHTAQTVCAFLLKQVTAATLNSSLYSRRFRFTLVRPDLSSIPILFGFPTRKFHPATPLFIRYLLVDIFNNSLQSIIRKRARGQKR